MSGFGYRITGDRVDKVEPAEALASAADLVWVHLASNEEARDWLCAHAALEDYAVDALTAAETRPRCEAFADGALVNLRGRSDEELPGSDVLASLRVWATRGRVFSVTRAHVVAVDTVRACVEAGEMRDPGDLIAAIAAAITQDLDPQVAELGDELDGCEEQLSADKVFELRRAVTRVRVTAIGYRRFLSPQRAALEKLASLPGDWLADDDRLHLNAAADRAARMAEELESIRERSAVVHDTLTDLRAEQLDTRGLIIAIVAMIFLPLTFITGVYGMNVKGLPGAESPWAFDVIMLGCVLIAVGIVVYFTRRHWLGRG